jgi:hypothetical protein
MNVNTQIKGFGPIIVREYLSILKNSDENIKRVPANLIVATTKDSTFKAIFPEGTDNGWQSVYSLFKAISNIHTVKVNSSMYNFMLSQVLKSPGQVLKDKNIANIITSTGNCNAARDIMRNDATKLIDDKFGEIRKKSAVEQAVFMLNNPELPSEVKGIIEYILNPNKDININLKNYDSSLKSFNKRKDKNSGEKLEYLLSTYSIDKSGISVYNPTRVYIYRGCQILPLKAQTFEEAIESFNIYENNIEDKISDISMENRNGIKTEYANLCDYVYELDKI